MTDIIKEIIENTNQESDKLKSELKYFFTTREFEIDGQFKPALYENQFSAMIFEVIPETGIPIGVTTLEMCNNIGVNVFSAIKIDDNTCYLLGFLKNHNCWVMYPPDLDHNFTSLEEIIKEFPELRNIELVLNKYL